MWSTPALSNGELATWSGSPLTEQGRDGVAERLVVDDLEVDPISREVWVAGSPVMLTRIEFDLLVTLAEQPRRVFTREQLMQRAWGDAFDGSHVLDTHLSRLRCKVTAAGGRRVAHAVRGVGYRLRG
jgi:DNA-binding response OmpR family regulator